MEFSNEDDIRDNITLKEDESVETSDESSMDESVELSDEEDIRDSFPLKEEHWTNMHQV